MQIMILAAGFGTRLRPYTLVRPKPLFPIFDRPLLGRTITTLHQVGGNNIVVNAHHLAEQISRFVAGMDGVTVQLEPVVLGTGGGMRRVMDRFNGDPFLVINGDIVHDMDAAQVYEQHCSSGAAVTMVVHDCPRYNRVVVDQESRILGFGAACAAENSCPMLAFTGIQVVSPHAIAGLVDGVYADSISWYDHLIQAGEEVRAIKVTGRFWTDMGTPEDYLALHQRVLRDPALAGRLGIEHAGQHYCAANAVVAPSSQCVDWTVIGSSAVVHDNARLTRVVVWDGAVVPAGAVLSDTIVI